MSVRPIDIARRLGIPKQTVNNYLTQGMPLDTLEAAEAWYNSKSRKGNKDTPAAKESVINLSDLTDQIERQKQLVADAYAKYNEKLSSDDPDCNKFYATYDKAAKTLLEFQKNKDAQEIASQTFIRVDTAIERFGAVMNHIREELTQLGTKLAPSVNPDAPGRAMKIIDDEVRKMLERLSTMGEQAEQAVLKDAPEEAIIETDITETTEADNLDQQS